MLTKCKIKYRLERTSLHYTQSRRTFKCCTWLWQSEVSAREVKWGWRGGKDNESRAYPSWCSSAPFVHLLALQWHNAVFIMLSKRSETEDASDDNILPLESPINTVYIFFFCSPPPNFRKSSHFIFSTYGKRFPSTPISAMFHIELWQKLGRTMTLWKPASDLCDLNVHALPCETFFFPSFFQEAMAQKGFKTKTL